MYKLDKYDILDLQMFTNVNRGILKKYQLLADYEIKGEKNSDNYKEILAEIKHDIALESNCFNRLATDSDKCIALVEYLKRQDEFKNSPHVESNILSLNYTTNIELERDLLLAYLLNKFSLTISADTNFLATKISSPNTASDLGQIQNMLDFQISFQNVLNDDLLVLFLTLTEKQKDQTTNDYLKAKFVKLKYGLGYSVPNIRDLLIKQSFNIDANPYLGHEALYKIYNIPKITEQTIKDQLLQIQFMNYMQKILLLNDIELVNPDIMATALNLQAQIRAILIISGPDTNELFITIINQVLKELDNNYDSTNPKTIIKSILTEILMKISEDKSIPKIITLGRKIN